ncbi:MAG: arsenate reductase ArsC [Planctomycetota bacterium]
MPAAPRRILFLCTHNANRSQMAELWARHLHPGRLEVASAGTEPSEPHPLMRTVMEEAGVSTAGAHSEPLSDFLGQDWDLVVTLCDSAGQNCPVFPGARRTLHRSFEDPSRDGTLAAFRRVRDEIRAFVEELAAGETDEAGGNVGAG